MSEHERAEDDLQGSEEAMARNAERWDPDLIAFKPEELTDRLHRGMKIVDRDGAHLGTLVDTYTARGVGMDNPDPYEIYLKVDRTWPRDDLYVSSRFVGGIHDDTVLLTVTKADIADYNWSRPVE